eukprot:1174800-Prymnesium_polylepis.1
MKQSPQYRAAIVATIWSFVVTIIFAFAVVLPMKGQQATLDFFTGFLVEKSLSVDNLFVFLMLCGPRNALCHTHGRSVAAQRGATHPTTPTGDPSRLTQRTPPHTRAVRRGSPCSRARRPFFLPRGSFQYFKVPERHTQRVLTWGIFSALVLRGGMIAVGVAAVQRFRWVLLIFAL